MLDSLGITLERVRSEVAGRVAPCEEVSLRSPFTPRVKTVLERARREALVLGLDDIATEHILLALVREREGAAPPSWPTSAPTPTGSATW